MPKCVTCGFEMIEIEDGWICPNYPHSQEEIEAAVDFSKIWRKKRSRRIKRARKRLLWR